jgi:hypothetical protein
MARGLTKIALAVMLTMALPIEFAVAAGGGAGGGRGGIGAPAGAPVGGGAPAGPVGGGAPAGAVGGGAPNVVTGAPISTSVGVGTTGTSESTVGGGVGGSPGVENKPSPNQGGASPGATVGSNNPTNPQSSSSTNRPTTHIAPDQSFSLTGRSETAPDGVTTRIVAASPCSTAAHETDGTTTCVGIPSRGRDAPRR